MTPSLLLLTALFVVPFFWAIGMGFTNLNLWSGEETRFIGFDNFKRLFRDAGFLNSVKVTLIFLAAAVSGHFVLGFLFANLVRIKGIWGRKIIQISMLIPWLTPGLVAAYMWRSVFNTDFGWLNQILVGVGLERVDWLISYPLLSVLIVNWSRGMAIAYLLLSAALSNIPESVYDAAYIDGANSWQTLTKIKIPMIKYSILVTLLFSTFMTLLAFDMIYGLTGGGPMSRTEVFSIFIYHNGFQDMQLGYAGAISTVILLISLVLGVAYIRSLRVDF